MPLIIYELKGSLLLISKIPSKTHRSLSKFWKALHDSSYLTLHAIIYTWAAEQILPGWVLDLGCEYGLGSLLIFKTNPKLQVLGIDLDFPALRYSHDMLYMGRIPRINASAFTLPFASESFSGICMINLLHLVEDTSIVLYEVKRVLKSGGVAILSIPQEESSQIGQSRFSFIKQLEIEISSIFQEIIYPNEIYGKLPSLPSQTFRLERKALVWIALCRKN